MLVRKVMQRILLSRAACVFLGMAALLTHQGWVQAQLMAQAPGQEICEDNPERPSSIRKTVDVPELGIKVDIPENYRVAVMPEGIHFRGPHEIISESEFERFSCIARGGLAYGRGRFFEMLSIVDNPSGMSADTLIDSTIQASMYGRSPRAVYQGDSFNAVAALAPSSMSAAAWLLIPSTQQVLFIEIGCDCPIAIDDVFYRLSTISFL
ncbi:MAG: hypothetical protein EA367_02535 [Leptolyngbya sp. DLM2.Bin15]|nr:MAG: hypothetical protein EA367_02535 [Leptolyngbya sp. DLM2.Bin15]